MSDSGGYGVWETCGSARIVTAAAVAGGLRVRGTDCAFLLLDTSGVGSPIAVPTVEGLRELLAALRPARIEFECSDEERLSLRALCGIADA